jgi:hypothetical protein
VPQDVAEVTGGSSASDATAAEAMAKAGATAEAEEAGPDEPPESIAKAAASRGSKKKGKPAEGSAE